MEYIRLSENYKKNSLIPVSDSPYKHIKNKNSPYFVSMIKYNTEHFKHWKETNTLRGLDGGKTNKIWIDFDRKENLTIEDAFKDAYTCYERLIKLGLKDNNIEISFSGNKGVGFIINTDTDFTNEEVQSICTKLADGLKTFDTSMYDHQRIFRLLFTKNEKSGLYKIPLSPDELKEANIEEIKNTAKSLDDFNAQEIIDSYKPYAVTPEFKNLSISDKPVVKEKKTSEPSSVDFAKKPSQWRNCKWSLLQGNFKGGERHQALCVIAATCRGLGYDKDTTYYMCKSALKKQATISGNEEFSKDELYNNIIEQSVFTDTWEGGQYTCQKPGWLQTYCTGLGKSGCSHSTKNDDPVVLEPSDLVKAFDNFVKNFDNNRIMTGLKPIDDNVNITIGQPIGILAAPSVGKTSLLLTILNNTSRQGLHSMFFSLDMYNVLITQKLIQKFSNYKFEKLKDLVMTNPPEAVKFYQVMEEEMKHMHTVVRSGVTVADMRSIVQTYEQEHGIKIKLIAVDYLELISGPFSDETANSAFNSKALKDLATDLEVCVIVLLQPQKTAEPDEAITSYRKIKGASMLEQSFRIVFSLYRPGFSCNNPADDRYIGINCVKNTMGPLFSTHLGFDGLTGSVRELSEEEEYDLKTLLDRKKAEKEGAKSDGWN